MEYREISPTLTALTASEAAVELGVHVNTVKRLLSENRLPGAYRIGKRGDWRIPRTSIEAYKAAGGTWR